MMSGVPIFIGRAVPGISASMTSNQERRRFHRFPFHADCELLVEDGQGHPCELLDLSINGALVQLDGSSEFDSERPGDLGLKLRGLTDDGKAEMLIGVRAVRIEDRCIACRFVDVDPDAFENLKNLVAANLGDLSMLDRELTQLDYWPGLSVSPGAD